MIFTIILSVIAVIAVLSGTIAEAHSRRVYGQPRKEVMKLSWPAQQTLVAYHAVPVDNRPAVDIMTVLRALDKKHGGRDKVDAQYRSSNYQGDSYYRWGNARSGSAYYNDYFVLHRGFEEVATAIAEREHTFAMAGISSHLEEAKSLQQVLKEERDMIREITSKVKEDMRVDQG